LAALSPKQKRFCFGISNFPKETNGKIFIYTISDPVSGLVRYIGKTKNPHVRFRKHKTQNNRTHICQWIKGLKTKGLPPIFEIIDECPSDNWDAKERHYIKLYRAVGAKLLNTMPGGEGGPTMLGRKLTEEQRKKIGDSKRGRPRPDMKGVNFLEKSIKVRQLDLRGNLIRMHDSISAAAKAIGRSARRIQGMIDGKGIRGRPVLSVGGFKFEKHGG
jgi:hypothetical protein